MYTGKTVSPNDFVVLAQEEASQLQFYLRQKQGNITKACKATKLNPLTLKRAIAAMNIKKSTAKNIRKNILRKL